MGPSDSLFPQAYYHSVQKLLSSCTSIRSWLILSTPFQFIIHQSSYHWCYMVWDAGIAVKSIRLNDSLPLPVHSHIIVCLHRRFCSLNSNLVPHFMRSVIVNTINRICRRSDLSKRTPSHGIIPEETPTIETAWLCIFHVSGCGSSLQKFTIPN